jgi:hypothetical protein
VAEVLGPRGVAFDPTVLASETSFLVVNNDSTDHANLATDSFGTHPAVQSLARTTRKSAVAFLGTGSFEPASGSSDPPATLVKTRPDAFADQNGNLRLDPPDEAPAEHDLAVAVERGHSRIALFADASWLDQRALGTLKANQVMLFGTLQWLAGDEPDPEESAADPQLVAYPLRPIPGG